MCPPWQRDWPQPSHRETPYRDTWILGLLGWHLHLQLDGKARTSVPLSLKQYTCTYSIHLHLYNTPVPIQYTCTFTVHLHLYSTPASIQYTSIYTIHLHLYNTPPHIQYNCNYTIHLHINNTLHIVPHRKFDSIAGTSSAILPNFNYVGPREI